jgi:hypothetical protein
VVGHDWDQAVAEIQIPDTVVNSKLLNALPTAKVLQPFVRILPRVPNLPLEGNVKIGGLLVIDGQLIGTAYAYYDAAGKAVKSHLRLQSLNLSSANVEGLFQVGVLGGGFVGGYMAPIPEEWKDSLGSPYVTGQAALCIIGRTSSGPAAFGFDPGKLGPMTAQITPYVYYPLTPVRIAEVGRLEWLLSSAPDSCVQGFQGKRVDSGISSEALSFRSGEQMRVVAIAPVC